MDMKQVLGNIKPYQVWEVTGCGWLFVTGPKAEIKRDGGGFYVPDAQWVFFPSPEALQKTKVELVDELKVPRVYGDRHAYILPELEYTLVEENWNAAPRSRR